MAVKKISKMAFGCSYRDFLNFGGYRMVQLY
jgi:hypothetical protein